MEPSHIYRCRSSANAILMTRLHGSLKHLEEWNWPSMADHTALNRSVNSAKTTCVDANTVTICCGEANSAVVSENRFKRIVDSEQSARSVRL